MASALHFQKRGHSLGGGGVLMKLRLGIAALGLATLLAGSVAFVPTILGQQPSAESAKRKVRSRVTPDYPTLAKQLNVTGRVKLEATISADGRVTNTKVVGGSPILVSAAQDALKKWKFEPAAKDTTEIIEFDFSGQN
jgi:TonB family protein